MKFTKSHSNRIKEFIDKLNIYGCCGSCLGVEHWMTGRYDRFKSPRALPPFVHRVGKKDCMKGFENSYVLNRAKCYFENNTRRQVVLVLDRPAMLDFLFDCARGCELN